MTALAESRRYRRPLLDLLAVELAPRDGRWAAVARIAQHAIEQLESEVQHVASAMH